MLLALNFENIGGSYRWALFLQTIVSFSKCQKLRKLDRYVAGLKLGKPMGYVSGFEVWEIAENLLLDRKISHV